MSYSNLFLIFAIVFCIFTVFLFYVGNHLFAIGCATITFTCMGSSAILGKLQEIKEALKVVPEEKKLEEK